MPTGLSSAASRGRSPRATTLRRAKRSPPARPVKRVEGAPEAVTVDGSLGEGGGQIVRTSLALAVLLGTELTLFNIRAGRSKPGLQAQHLTGVRAAAAISHAEVEGA